MLFLNQFGEGDSKSDSPVEEYTNGEDLGKAIGKDFITCTESLVEILKKDLSIEALKTEVEKLRDKYIEIFVAYGHQKEKMDQNERMKCDQAIWNIFSDEDQKRLEIITEKINTIRSEDNDLANMIANMNIITQYADFELLKKQAPDEAKRLGVE